jgi:hypothetical protein
MAERFFARKTTLDDAGRFMTDLIDNQGVVGETITTTATGIGTKGYIVFTYLNDIPVVSKAGGAVISYEVGDAAPTWSTLVEVTDGDHASGYTLAIDTSAVDMNTVGTFDVGYVATDASGNASELFELGITITADVTVPVITSPDVAMDTGDMEVEGYAWTNPATALDNIDGDITTDIVATYFKANGTTELASISLLEQDLYAGLTCKVKNNVEDSSDNSATEVISTITVTDTTAPIMILSGATADVAGVDVAAWDPDTLYVTSVIDNKDGVISAVITFKEENSEGSAIASLAAARTYLGTEGNKVYCIYNANDAATNSAAPQYGTVTAIA